LFVTDNTGQKLAYVYFEAQPGTAISGEAADEGRGAAHRGEAGKESAWPAEPWTYLRVGRVFQLSFLGSFTGQRGQPRCPRH
jgi:hypothetical protein